MPDDPDLPDQKELEKELSDYLSKKYGDRVKVVSPLIMPRSKKGKKDKGEQTQSSSLDRINFQLRPHELKEYLDRYIIKQERAKAIVATKVCTHFNRIQFDKTLSEEDGGRSVGQIKNNIIMIGPTGVGKTYMIKLVAWKLGVPMVKADATKFSETGYVGGDVEDLIRQLYHEAGEDKDLAEHGIVYLDEIDKIASSHSFYGPDVSRTGVQRALLKPMEETEVDIKVPHDPISQLQAIERYRRTGKHERKTINTRNILFIVSGAFPELIPIVRKRLQRQGIGFTAQVSSPQEDYEYLQHVRAEDLMEYGFESEFVGRLPVTAILDPLDENDLYQILKNPNNPILTSKKKDFRSYGIDLKFDDAALGRLAQVAVTEKTGARALVSAIERTLMPFESKLPSTDIRRLSVTLATVENPDQDLEALLREPDAADRLQDFDRLESEEREELLSLIRQQEELLQYRYSLSLTPSRANLLADFISTHFLDVGSAASRLDKIYEEVEACAVDFFEKYGLSVEFDEGAADELVRRVLVEGEDPGRVCHIFARDFEYGLKLIKDKTGQSRFTITREAIREPEAFLNDLITDLFQGQE